MKKISRGLNIPITGQPDQRISEDSPVVRTVALVGRDYVGLKPTMEVAVGDTVKKGQLLFTDKKTPGVKFTAPASGRVIEINRGQKRVFESLVIECAADDKDQITFSAQSFEGILELGAKAVKEQLVESGLWTSFRTRPFSKVPATNTQPADIFVNAMDTHPLAADPALIIEEKKKIFEAGLAAISQLTQGKTYLCTDAKSVFSQPSSSIKNLQVEQFAGKHPSGLTGTHIHFLSPVGMEKTVWSINYQDVIAIGHLFLEGEINTDRVISLAGPSVKNPRLIRTRLGANLKEVTQRCIKPVENRMISGSVVGGRHARGAERFLGRYHLQVTVLEEGFHRQFMGWLSPGLNKFSNMGIYISKFLPKKNFAFTTNTNGSPRAMVPVGAYERVMPLDILPTQLLRAIIVGDIESAIKLGALELDEEDLALCTFVCPGKYEYGPILRDMLTRIEKEAM